MKSLLNGVKSFFGGVKDAWLMTVVKILIERVPVLSKIFKVLDGKKALIGRILMFLSAVLFFLSSPEGLPLIAPELLEQYPKILEHLASVMAGIGWVMTELGLQHKVVKEKEKEKEDIEKAEDVKEEVEKEE
jgi:hypothetical protein